MRSKRRENKQTDVERVISRKWEIEISEKIKMDE